MNVEDVISDLQDDEGFRPFAYPDSEGYLTIGFGTLVDPRKGGITMDEGMYLLRNRLATNLGRLDQLRPTGGRTPTKCSARLPTWPIS